MPATAMAMNQMRVIGPKKAATLAVPRDCTANKAKRINTVSGTTVRFESGSGDLEAFHRRQNRNRRGDQRVAVEQRGADDAEHDDGEALAPERARGKRHQSQRSTFAFVVGAEEDQHIFDGNNEDQCPNDQRKDAENDGLARSLTAAAAASTNSRSA